MINGKDNRTSVLQGRTYSSDSDDNTTTLSIPKEFAKELDIENCKVSITVLHGLGGRKHLIISKYHKEIVLN
jgi:hypothetical protein